jgi:hypothetical protein
VIRNKVHKELTLIHIILLNPLFRNFFRLTHGGSSNTKVGKPVFGDGSDCNVTARLEALLDNKRPANSNFALGKTEKSTPAISISGRWS